MRLFVFVCVLAVAMTAASRGADEPVQFSITPPRKGEEMKVTVRETTATKFTVVMSGKETVTEETQTKEFVYTESVEDTDKKLKVKRQYTIASTTKTSPKDMKGMTEDLPHKGQTVWIEGPKDPKDKKEKRTFRTGDSAVMDPDEKLRDMLDEEFNKGDQDFRKLLFPKGHVKTGYKWGIEPGAWMVSLGAPELTVNVSDLRGVGGKLQKTENRAPKDKDGKQIGKDKPYAEATVDFDLPITGANLGETAKAFKLEKGSRLFVHIESKGMADGTAPQDTTTKITYVVKGSLDGHDVQLEVAVTEHRKHDPKK